MADRRSETLWRQGHILSSEALRELRLADGADDPIAILISHDCDIAANKSDEPCCEVVIGRAIESVDGNYTGGKNPRKLHLSISGGDVTLFAEFDATSKSDIPKETLFQFSPSRNAKLTHAERSDLVKWLVARYRREALPDQFIAQFKEDNLLRRFTKIIKNTSTHIHAIFFDLDSGGDVERQDPSDTYSLAIHLVYNVDEDPRAAQEAAEHAAKDISAELRRVLFSNGKWNKIELIECIAYSEDSYSIYNARMVTEWRFDYLSMEIEPE